MKRFLEEEIKALNKVSEAYKKLIKVPCTACRYCSICPQGIDIPKVLKEAYDFFE